LTSSLLDRRYSTNRHNPPRPTPKGYISTDDRAQIFRVELRRERGRADQVAEHDGEVATFRGLPGRRLDGGGGLCGGCNRRTAEGGNRLQQPLSVSERHAEFPEVPFAQLRQNLAVDLVRAEHRLILSEAEAPQPTADFQVSVPWHIHEIVVDHLIRRSSHATFPEVLP
jgi:hypothetical protein